MAKELIHVHKLAYDGRETWRWSGELAGRNDGVTVVDAIFNGPPRDLGYMQLETTDLYHEFYYTDRWFNIFQVFRADGLLKGWYCNVCQPAKFSGNEIFYVDMALDVFVHPDGRAQILDEEEFEEKAKGTYSAEDAGQARAAVSELLEMVNHGTPPFDGTQRPKQDVQDRQG